MVAESNRLYRLVEDLMVLARFDERIELVRDPSLVQHLIPAVLDSERARWPQVTFVFDEPPALPAVGGDDTSIQQVLRNMLSNAAKYSPLGSTVSVRANEEDGGVAVHVLDEGPGIEPSEAAELFDPFYRSPTTSAMASGAGIGLYVSRRLVDAMGGRIWARRREGRGSDFGFWLPQFASVVDEPAFRDVPIEVGARLDTHL
jgi:two-component system OmpR family sensor kinase